MFIGESKYFMCSNAAVMLYIHVLQFPNMQGKLHDVLYCAESHRFHYFLDNRCKNSVTTLRLLSSRDPELHFADLVQ